MTDGWTVKNGRWMDESSKGMDGHVPAWSVCSSWIVSVFASLDKVRCMLDWTRVEWGGVDCVLVSCQDSNLDS